MKVIFLLSLFFCFFSDFSVSEECSFLTDEEFALWNKGDSKSNAVVYEFIYSEAANNDKQNSITDKVEREISWKDATQLITLGTVHTVYEFSSGEIRLISNSGRIYVSKESKRGEVHKLILKVDPCRRWIKEIVD